MVPTAQEQHPSQQRIEETLIQTESLLLQIGAMKIHLVSLTKWFTFGRLC